MTVYVVGSILDTNETGRWEFRGVFSTPALAEARCAEYNDFVGPADIDSLAAANAPEGTPWPGAYFPHGLAAERVTTLQGIVEQLRSCKYECEAGPLELNMAFMELVELANMEQDV